MFSAETLGALLHSLATGNPGRAENLVLSSDELTEEERALLWDRLSATDDPAARARGMGDALRGRDGWDFAVNECYRAAFYLGDGVGRLREDPLFAYFSSQRAGRVLDKWVHYFPVYTRHFGPYRGRRIRILEVGVYRGGSLDMWNWFFGPSATIVGIDIDERAKDICDPRHAIEIGDQTDVEFLRRVAAEHGPFDIVIDDGGHEVHQQIVTAETLFPLLADGGLLLVEDCHTSYWEQYGGGRGRSGTFIEWAKERIDDVNGYYQRDAVEPVWTDHVDGVHFYDSIVVFDKKARFAPFAEQVGNAEFLNYPRAAAGLITELLATRDAAIAERDALREEIAGGGPSAAADEEFRLLRGETNSLRTNIAAIGDRLRQTKSELDTARDTVRQYRQNSHDGADPDRP